MFVVVYAAPWRGEEDDVVLGQGVGVGVGKVYKVGGDKGDAVLDAVEGGIVLCEGDLVGINVERDDVLAGHGELDGVAAGAAEGVEGGGGGAALGDAGGDSLGRDRVPGLLVEQDAGAEQGEERVPLPPVLVQAGGHVAQPGEGVCRSAHRVPLRATRLAVAVTGVGGGIGVAATPTRPRPLAFAGHSDTITVLYGGGRLG